MKVVDIKSLRFQYPRSQANTLDIASFEMAKNEKVFLFGPSGCGKTTFLEILSGVLVPQSGTISVMGKSISTMSPSQRDHYRAAHIGYIFQSFNLIPYLNVEENISLPLYLSKQRRARVSKEQESAKIQELCHKLGIEDIIQKPVSDLSVGQQQRVAAARAFIGQPELILADEPTSSLDFDHRHKFIELLFDLSKQNGTSVLFVSHDRSLMNRFDRAVSLPEINIGATI